MARGWHPVCLRARRFCIGLIAMVAICAAQATPATAGIYSSLSLGNQWDASTSAEGQPLNTQPAAEAFGNAFQSLGFSNTLLNNGGTATAVTESAAQDTAMAFFGHSLPYVMTLDNPPPGGTMYNQAQLMFPRSPSYSTSFDGASVISWAAWGRPVLDKMKYIILGGCFTANDGSDLAPEDQAQFGSWTQDGTLAGVDNIIGWHELLFWPQNYDPNSYGSYWAGRAASYARNRYSIGSTLTLAASDLYQSSGSYYGWNTWADGGLAPKPYTTDFAAGIGTPIADSAVQSSSTTTQSFSSVVNSANRTETVSVDGEAFTDHLSPEGGLYRTDRSGDLVFFSAPALNAGAPSITEADARTRALTFLQQRVPAFDTTGYQLVSSEETHHVDGDLISEFEWATPIAGTTVGPQRTFVSVDRISGDVTGFQMHEARPTAVDFTVSQHQAEQAALAEVGGRVIATTREVWTRPIWRVTIAHDNKGPFPAGAVVEVDGVTGQVRGVGVA